MFWINVNKYYYCELFNLKYIKMKNQTTFEKKIKLVNELVIDLNKVVETQSENFEQINYQLSILNASVIQALKYLENHKL